MLKDLEVEQRAAEKIEAEVNSYFNLGRIQSKQCINNYLISAGAETKTVNYP